MANSYGLTQMTRQETVDVYRSIAGALPTEVASGIYISHIYPLEGNLDTTIDYVNFKSFEIKQAFTLYSGILTGDEIHLNSGIFDVRVVNDWQHPRSIAGTVYHLIVEEVK